MTCYDGQMTSRIFSLAVILRWFLKVKQGSIILPKKNVRDSFWVPVPNSGCREHQQVKSLRGKGNFTLVLLPPVSSSMKGTSFPELGALKLILDTALLLMGTAESPLLSGNLSFHTLLTNTASCLSTSKGCPLWPGAHVPVQHLYYTTMPLRNPCEASLETEKSHCHISPLPFPGQND